MFSNDQVETGSLPTIEQLQFQSLPHAYQYTQILTRVIWLMVFVVFYFVIITARSDPETLVRIQTLWPGLLILAIGWLLWPIVAHRARGFALREHDIVFKSGVIWKRITAIAFSRIQHIESKQGPFHRLFDIADLQLYTAGGSGGDLTVPGLLSTQASSIRKFILGHTHNIKGVHHQPPQ